MFQTLHRRLPALGSIDRELEPTDTRSVFCPVFSDKLVFTTPYYLETRDPVSWSVQWDLAKDESGGSVMEPPEICRGTVITAYENVGEERVYIGQDEGEYPRHVRRTDPSLKALDADTGALRWERSLPGRARSPAIVDGVAYLATRGSDPQGHVYTTIRSCSDEQPVPDGEPTDYSEFGTVHAIDVETGAEYWSQVLDVQASTMPAVYQWTLCFGTSAETVVALDTATGEHRWETTINDEGSVISWPTIAADTIYVGSREEYLYALDRHDGHVRWKFETESAADSNPAIVDNSVYIGDNLGNVYALSGQ